MSTAHASYVAARRESQRGFTLIELLMVILLVGTLAALLLVAINSALRRAQDAAVQTEIDQMSTAIESFKSERGTYPLTMGDTLYDVGVINDPKTQRLLRHLAKAFPRYVVTIRPPATNMYEAIQLDIAAGSQYLVDSGARTTPLDWSTLDPAESLVFWLGGFPDPNSETKLIGFRKDPANPFRYPNTGPNEYLKNRTTPLFQFKPERLVDRDKDGWWEYVQEGTAEGDMPPYVYFDPTTYNIRPYYPTDALNNMPGANTVSWGHAVPYAMADTKHNQAANTKVLWANSQKFQIIAPGRDGSYGRAIGQNPQTLSSTDWPTTTADPTPAQMEKFNCEVRLYPTCELLRPTTSYAQVLLPDLELDNLTNFTTGKLGDEKE